MAINKHIKFIKKGVDYWNKWRDENLEIKPDLSSYDLENADLNGVDFSETDLRGANLFGAELEKANFTNAQLIGACLNEAVMNKAILNWTDASTAQFCGTDLTKANLKGSWFCEANMRNAILSGANMNWTDLGDTNLANAMLQSCDLSMARLVRTNLKNADLTGCRVYGCSAWDIKENNTTMQNNLIITPKGKPIVTVDNLKVAQFVYLLLTNKNIRDVINTVAKKAVLILGCFSRKRKMLLVSISDKLRKMDYCPIIFDFQKSEEQDIIETIITLASLSKFIIADVTEARVISDELRSFVPDFAIPVVPIFQPSKREDKPYASLYTLHKKYDWVFEPVLYKNEDQLINTLFAEIIKSAETKRLTLNAVK